MADRKQDILTLQQLKKMKQKERKPNYLICPYCNDDKCDHNKDIESNYLPKRKPLKLLQIGLGPSEKEEYRLEMLNNYNSHKITIDERIPPTQTWKNSKEKRCILNDNDDSDDEPKWIEYFRNQYKTFPKRKRKRKRKINIIRDTDDDDDDDDTTPKLKKQRIQ